MSRSEPHISKTAISLMREDLRGAVHPSTSRLIAYHCGEIPPTEMSVIREHLSLCEECSSLVLDAAKFFVEDDVDGTLEGIEAETGWRELQAELSANDHPSALVIASGSVSIRSLRSLLLALPFAYSIAAAFAVLSVVAFFFKDRGSSMQPQVNTGLYYLKPSAPEQLDEVPTEPIHFGTIGDSALLVLSSNVEAGSSRYGLDIRSADGSIVWQFEDLVPQLQGGFHLTLPANALPPGQYSLELYRITERGEMRFGTYSIVVELN